jgi:hypothetical protein
MPVARDLREAISGMIEAWNVPDDPMLLTNLAQKVSEDADEIERDLRGCPQMP